MTAAPQPHQAPSDGSNGQWTWQSLREYLYSKYRGSYSTQELRDMEIKWRKIFIAAGWSVKGQ